METRTNKIILYVGNRNTGKTSYMKNLIDVFPQPKKLIVDTLDNPVWRNMVTWDHPEWVNRIIPIMPVDKLQHHQQGVYRIFSSDTVDLQQRIATHVMNTAIIFEDARRYFSRVLTKPQISYLLNSKQMNCDVHLVFHNLNQIPTELVLYADWIVLFKTGEETFNKDKYSQPGFKEVFEKVKNSPNHYTNEVFQLN